MHEFSNFVLIFLVGAVFGAFFAYAVFVSDVASDCKKIGKTVIGSTTYKCEVIK